MTKLVDFKTRKTEQLESPKPTAAPPNEAILRLLDRIREDAESGYIQGLVVIGQTEIGEVIDGWVFDGEQCNPYIMIGGLDEMKADFSFAHIESRRRMFYDET